MADIEFKLTMIDIKSKPNGRLVRAGDIANELELAMLERFQDHMAQKLQGIHDPETGEAPKVTVKRRGLHVLSFVVSGSEPLVAEVKRRLG